MAPKDQSYEKLYLLEFLVDHVVTLGSKFDVDKDLQETLGPLVVKFQFLDFPAIEINEEDFSPSTKPLPEEKKILLKCGRSCMFSLSNLENVKLETRYDVRVTVSRKLPEAEEFLIGKTKISLFDVFKNVTERPCDGSDVSKTKSGAYKLLNLKGEEVGKVVFLARLSCFGKMVITEFKLTEKELEEKEKEIAKYRHERKLCEVAQDQESGDKISKRSNEKVEKVPKEGESKSSDFGKKFETPECPFEFKKLPPVCQCQCSRAVGQVAGYPVTLLENRPQQSTPGKLKDMDLDPGAVAIRGNQLVFQMPSKPAEHPPADGKFASSVYYTINEGDAEGARNIVKILPEVPGDPLGSKLSEKQDVLVLKLGKKRLAAGKLPKLEVELRTPKMKDEKPETDTQQTQYMESDIPKPPKPQSDVKSKKGGSKKK